MISDLGIGRTLKKRTPRTVDTAIRYTSKLSRANVCGTNYAGFYNVQICSAPQYIMMHWAYMNKRKVYVV